MNAKSFLPLEEGFNPHLALASLLCSETLTGDEVTLVTGRKRRWMLLPDWGTVVIGRDRIAPEFEDEVAALWEKSTFLFDAPEGFSMAHVVSNLGAFPSVSRARKNNWNKPIPPGISHWQFKVDGCIGELMTVAIPGTEWAAS